MRDNRFAQNLLSRMAGIDRDNPVAVGRQKPRDRIRRPAGIGGPADNGDGLYTAQQLDQVGICVSAHRGYLERARRRTREPPKKAPGTGTGRKVTERGTVK